MFKNLATNILIFTLTLIGSPQISATPIKFNDLTILVSSCDKYAPMWGPFFASLFEQWPSLLQENNNVPVLLIANHKSYHNHRVTMINIPHESSWADNMLTALQQVNTKYVLIALDDYWITQPVNETRLNELYQTMQTEHAAMLQLSNHDPRYQDGQKHATTSNLMYINKFAHYKVSLQLAIWDTEALKVLLRPGEDPWAFELSGTARSHGYPQAFLSTNADIPIRYLNAAHQGHINPAAIEYAKQHQIPFNYAGFPVLGKFNYKITYNTWKKRAQKLISFLQQPGSFYQSEYVQKKH